MCVCARAYITHMCKDVCFKNLLMLFVGWPVQILQGNWRPGEVAVAPQSEGMWRQEEGQGSLSS